MHLLAVDVQYRGSTGFCAGVSFEEWTQQNPTEEYVARRDGVNDYVPGNFYLRELPCIIDLLSAAPRADYIIIDGYVFLADEHHPGLGKHLFDAIGEKSAVIGVAKTRFHNVPERYEIYRGKSRRPLFVSCVGCTMETAKESIRSMHGEGRIPTLLKSVDDLCRRLAS
jgi:deoxyribonuclease V